jgi:hypothetical protein
LRLSCYVAQVGLELGNPSALTSQELELYICTTMSGFVNKFLMLKNKQTNNIKYNILTTKPCNVTLEIL